MPQENHLHKEVTLRSLGAISEIDAGIWNELNAKAGGSCLSSHEMLLAMESSGSVCLDTGWHPRHLVIEAETTPLCAIILYAKGHSYGEFVFDWAWADAYQRHGLKYYPKWLSAIPYTPVTGPRLLCDPAHKPLAAQALVQWAKKSELSSLHVLYTDPSEQQLLSDAGCLTRKHTQFHWFNQGWGDFEEFLSSLSQSKRKKIRAERRKVSQAGIRTEVLTGEQISQSHWDFFYRCYSNTYALRGNPPYLTRDFFTQVGEHLPQNCLLVLAYDGSRPIASALSWLDDLAGQRKLYGRYWGSIEHVDCLHFEVAYYCMIEWAIANEVAVIEGGAQGEHKMARGFIPVQTQSAHWLAHEGFYSAVQSYLQQEAGHIEEYTASLNSPFRRG